MEEELKLALSQKDAAYRERNSLVAAFARAVTKLRGGRAWLARHDPSDKEWDEDWKTIVFVQLPSGGQLSWHIHDSEVSSFSFLFGKRQLALWDGHTTEQKYGRLRDWTEKGE